MTVAAVAVARRIGVAATLLLGAAALAGSIVLATTIGPSGLGAGDVWAVVVHKLGLSAGRAADPIEQAIVWELRMPRVLMDAIVGAGLAVVGVVMQAVTRNPLADPYLLGLSSGASLGAVAILVLGLGGGAVGLGMGAFLGALAAFAAVIALAASDRRLDPATTVLAGVAVGSVCSALTSLVVVVVAEPHKTQAVLYWLLGSVAGTDWPAIAVGLPALAGGLAICLLFGRSLNALAFGDDDAAALGVPTTQLRWVLLVTCALLTGVLVSLSGAIGFVGLLLPHAARIVVGRDHRRLLPAAALAGAIFLVWTDTAARTLFAPQEIPVGIVTALFGAPAFAILVRRRRRAP